MRLDVGTAEDMKHQAVWTNDHTPVKITRTVRSVRRSALGVLTGKVSYQNETVEVYRHKGQREWSM